MLGCKESCYTCNDGGDLAECRTCLRLYHMTEKCAGRDVDPDGDFECDRCDPDNIRFDGQETCEANWGKGKKKKPERIKLVNPDYYDNGTVEVDMQGKTLLKLPVLKRETGNIKVIWEKDGAISYKSIKCIKKVVERPERPESPPPPPYEMSRYEKFRKNKIERNKKRLAEIGLEHGVSGFDADGESKVTNSSWNLELENCCLVSQYVLILPKLFFHYTETETEFRIRVRRFRIRVNRGR